MCGGKQTQFGNSSHQSRRTRCIIKLQTKPEDKNKRRQQLQLFIEATMFTINPSLSDDFKQDGDDTKVKNLIQLSCFCLSNILLKKTIKAAGFSLFLRVI